MTDKHSYLFVLVILLALKVCSSTHEPSEDAAVKGNGSVSMQEPPPDIKNKINFLKMTYRNCSVAYLPAGDFIHKFDGDSENEPDGGSSVDDHEPKEGCLVGFWLKGILPEWIHPVSRESLAHTLRRISQEKKSNFTKQLCPCKNVEVTPSCPKDLTQELISVILPCLRSAGESQEEEEEYDEEEKEELSEEELLSKIQDAENHIKLFKEAKLQMTNEKTEQFFRTLNVTS